MKCSINILIIITATSVFVGCNKDSVVGPINPTAVDTTSHEFTWTKLLLGDGAGSSLYDVAIINDSLAYAVGEIYFIDGAGKWNPLPCNLAKWNGTKWEPSRITIESKYGQVTSPFYGICTIASNDLWLCSGLPIHGDGNNWTQYDLYDMGLLDQNDGYLTKIWAHASNDVYFVGTKGAIVHYKNGTWTKINSGTSLSINDIYGSFNSFTQQWEILAVAGDVGSSFDRKILQIVGTQAIALSDSSINSTLSSVWFVAGQHYYVIGDGIYDKGGLSDYKWNVHLGDITTYYTTRVRGQAISDVFMTGAYGEVLHYNGLTWRSYQASTGLAAGSYSSLALKGDLLIAVGHESGQAAILIGRRK